MRTTKPKTTAPRPGRGRIAGTLLAVALLAGACSDVSSPGGTMPAGPVADLSEQLSGGKGAFVGEAVVTDLAAVGFVQDERVAAGTAVSYAAVGPMSRDGRWTFVADGSAPYRTRIVVRRPATPRSFSGTVVLEWLNVSGGLDGGPDWTSLAEEIVRRGHAWVGVSAQRIGIEGGPVLVIAPGAEGIAGKGLVNLDPERYGSLSHPGDGFSFDILTQVARAVRSGGVATGGARVQRVIAAGESQSAIALTTYYDGVQPLTRAFDGFFVHSRASVPLPLVGPGEYADLAGGFAAIPVLFRDDLDAPVMDLQSEGDVTSVLDSVVVRQPDSATFRLWEVAGTSHADAHLLGPLAGLADCGAPVNDGPLHLVAKAALRALGEWVRSGTEPPVAAQLATEGTPAEIGRDPDGIALGGIRTPPVDVPVKVLSGEPGSNPDLFCILLGSTRPLPAGRLAQLYSSRADYGQRYRVAAHATVAAGFVLEEDRAALLDYADPSGIAP
jgi:Alpha/beta hydrolase domain